MLLPLIPLQTVFFWRELFFFSNIKSGALSRSAYNQYACINCVIPGKKNALSPITKLARNLLFWHAQINKCAKSNCL